MLKRIEQFSLRLLPWTVYAIIVITVLLPKLPVSDVEGTYVKIRFEDFVNVVAGLVLVATLVWTKRKFFTEPIHQAIFLYLFVGLVSTIAAIYITQVVPQNLAILSWLRRIEYMMFFFVGAYATMNFKDLYRYVITLFITAIGVIIYGLGQAKLGWCSISTTNREFSKGVCIPVTTDARPNATFGGHYDLAIFLSYLVPLIIAVGLTSKKYWQYVALTGLFIGTFILLYVSQSRTAFFAAAVTVCVLLWVYGKKLILIACFIVAILGAMTVGRNLVTRYTTTASNIIMKIEHPVQPQVVPIDDIVQQSLLVPVRAGTPSALPGQEKLPNLSQYQKLHPRQYPTGPDPALETKLSNSIRFDVEWPNALRAFYRDPLLGSGYASMGTLFSTQYGFATDNDYLRSLGETGLLGTLAFGLIFVAYFKLMKRFLRSNIVSKYQRTIILGFFAAIVGFFANAVAIDAFESSKLAILFWLFLGITYSAMRHALDGDYKVS